MTINWRTDIDDPEARNGQAIFIKTSSSGIMMCRFVEADRYFKAIIYSECNDLAYEVDAAHIFYEVIPEYIEGWVPVSEVFG